MERIKMYNTSDNNELKKDVIERFRNELPVLRAKARVSQELLAEKIGVSRQTYSAFETGKREMSWTFFLALLAFFQNNEQTKQMLGQMDDLESDAISILSPNK